MVEQGVEQNRLDILKLKQIIKRRKWWLIIPFSLVVILSVAIAFLLPNIYQSTATVLIKTKQIPSELVPSTVTSYAEQRIQAITQEIMSRTRIINLVKKYDLLPEKRDKLSIDEIVEKIIKRIHVEPITAEIHTGNASGRPTLLTIAFTVSYEDEDPKKAQLVTNEIVSFYLEKNIESVKEHAKETTKFLEAQLKEVKQQIEDLENKIAEYRKKHLEELPEFSNINMQKLEKLNIELSNIDMQLRSLMEQKAVLENKLTSIDPYAGSSQKILSPEERLQQAKLEYSALLSKYSEKHPLVIAKKREILLLEKQTKNMQSLEELKNRLHELNIKLSELTSKYSEKHPWVKSVRREIKKVKKQIAELKEQIGKMDEEVIDATNPAYIQIKSELDKIKVSISSLKAERNRIEAQMNEIYNKLHAMPEVAKKYNELMLDYENAKAHYNELQKKVMFAKISESLEEKQLGEKFEVIEPAFLPEKPSKPNRVIICLTGFILGLGLSVFSASFVEYVDKKIYDSDFLEKVSGADVLSVIPKIETEEEIKKKKRKKFLIIVSIIAGFVIIIFLFHFFVMDLYVFWAKLTRVVQRNI